jgi:predicted aconitase with swiveling domain
MSTHALSFTAQRSLRSVVVGEALVSNDAISMRYDVDAETGMVRRPTHDLYGKSIAGKVLIFRNTKGGVSTGWALLYLKSKGTAPAALVCDVTNPVFVQGAALAGLPIMDGFESSPRFAIESGDMVELDGNTRILRIIKKSASR